MPNEQPVSLPLKDREEFRLFYQSVQKNLRIFEGTPLTPFSSSLGPVVYVNDKKNLAELSTILEGNDVAALEKFIAKKIPEVGKIDKVLLSNAVSGNDKKILRDLRSNFIKKLFAKLNVEIAINELPTPIATPKTPPGKRAAVSSRGVSDGSEESIMSSRWQPTRPEPVLNLIHGLEDIKDEAAANALSANPELAEIKKFLVYNSKLDKPETKAQGLIFNGFATPLSLLQMSMRIGNGQKLKVYERMYKYFVDNLGAKRGTSLTKEEEKAYAASITALNRRYLSDQAERMRWMSSMQIKQVQPGLGMLYNLRAGLLTALHNYNISRIARTYNPPDFIVVKEIQKSLFADVIDGKEITTLSTYGAAGIATIKHMLGALLTTVEQIGIFAVSVLLVLPTMIYGVGALLFNQQEPFKYLTQVTANILKAAALIVVQLSSPVVTIPWVYVNIARFSYQGKFNGLKDKIFEHWKDNLPTPNLDETNSASKRSNANLTARRFLRTIGMVANKDPVLKFFIDNYDKNKFAGVRPFAASTLAPQTFAALHLYIQSARDNLNKGNKKLDEYIKSKVFIGDVKTLLEELEENLRKADNLSPEQLKTLKDLIKVVNAQLKNAGAADYHIDTGETTDSEREAANIYKNKAQITTDNPPPIILTTSFRDMEKVRKNSPVILVPGHIDSVLKYDIEPINNYTTIQVPNIWRSFSPRFAHLHDYQILDKEKHVVGRISFSRDNDNFTLHVLDDNKSVPLMEAYIEFVDNIKGVQGRRDITIENISREKFNKLKEYCDQHPDKFSVTISNGDEVESTISESEANNEDRLQNN